MLTFAHGVGGRADLPVPVWLAVYGAGIAVVLSFAALGVLWPQPRLRADRGRGNASFLDSPWLRWPLRVLVLAASLVLLAAAFAGAAGEERNPLPWFLYIVFWVGIVFVSLLLGPVWRVLNPLRTIHELVSRASGGDPDDGVRELPGSWGYWPAAGWLAAFVWVELVMPDRANPRLLGVLLLLYALVNLGAAALYGARWFERGDGFEVYSTLVGRLAPIGRLPDGRVALRNPLDNLTGLRPEPGLVAVVVVLLGSTAYDGVTRTQWWQDLAGEANAFTGTLALVGCCAFVAATYAAATRLSARPGKGDAAAMPAAFAHSVVPIAVGYAIAHYFSLLVLEGQQAWILASDPFATGADWFGTSDWTIDYTRVSTRTVALVQIGAIVVGHVLGVVAAHDRAVRLLAARSQVSGQLPLLMVMVGYTVSGLYLLFAS